MEALRREEANVRNYILKHKLLINISRVLAVFRICKNLCIQYWCVLHIDHKYHYEFHSCTEKSHSENCLIMISLSLSISIILRAYSTCSGTQWCILS